MRLLSAGRTNKKLRKSTGYGYLVAGLSLRPSDLSGYNVCTHSTKGCRSACVLEYSGRGFMSPVQQGRDRKTRLFFEHRASFLHTLHKDLDALERKATKLNLKPLVRLNVASDIRWEQVDPSIFTDHQSITFYDYTKDLGRFSSSAMPPNYELTYSYNENTRPSDVSMCVERGINVIVVFDTLYNPAYNKIGNLPETWGLHAVVDGDTHDIRLRSVDGSGVVVGLRGKGGKRRVITGVESGFIQATIGGVANIK